MTAIVLILAAYVALTVARRTYPATVGETLDHGGTPISPRGAMLFAGAAGAATFALIATPWLAFVPLGA